MFELTSTSGEVLLVGEGNFSFSSALLKKHRSFDARKLFATSYEPKPDCFKKYAGDGISKNITFLLESGATVLHGIDAMKLSEGFASKMYDLIIFQFPHIGRKAGIKLNRVLLKNFFCSARGCLNPNGSVIVTLCAGQGGTPADIIQREYCNSWQIVEMAASSDFILTEVEPFESDEFPGYLPTGRRNHGSTFITQKAMSHRFFLAGRPPPSFMPDLNTCCRYDVCNELSSALQNRIEFLEKSPKTFPCYWMSREITKRLGFEDHFTCETLKKEACQWMTESTSQLNSFSLLEYASKDFTQLPSRKNTVYHGTSLNASYIMNTIILPALRYDILVITNSTSHEIVSKLSGILSDFCDRQLILDKRKRGFESRKHLNIIQSDGFCINEDSIYDILVIIGTPQREAFVGMEFEVVFDRQQEGDIFRAITLNIADVIPLLNSGLRDQRLLWLPDEVTRTRVIESLKDKMQYVPKSLYPPRYIHDFSFWMENTQDPMKLPFSEENLTRVLQWTTHDIILSLEFLEEYYCQSTGRKSLCYRVVYESHDFALSRENCLGLQECVRRNLCMFFNITVR